MATEPCALASHAADVAESAVLGVTELNRKMVDYEKRIQEACVKSDRAADSALAFGWRLNAVLALLGATFLTIVGGIVGMWQRADRIEGNAVKASSGEARTIASDELRRFKSEIREELKLDRVESYHEFRRQERAEVDRLTARVPR